MPTGHAYSATRVLLELDGDVAASLSRAEGGESFADVVPEPPSAGRVKKHLGPVRCAPITIAFGAGIGKPLFEWLAGALAGKHEAHDGALIFLDYKSTASARLKFKAARITDIAVPMYSATMKEPASWEVVLQPEAASLSHESLGTFHPSAAVKGSKAWLACNFSFSISGLENACAKVSTVEPIQIHFPEAADAAPEVGNLAVMVSNTALASFQTWHEDFVVAGHNADEFERSGSLIQRSADLKEALCAVELQNVGIVRISPERFEGTTDVIAKSRIELYVEAVELKTAVLASFAPAPAPTEDAKTPTGSGEMAGPRGAELAARLRLTDPRFRIVDDRPPRQREGEAAGEAWARRTASLEELESIAGLSGEWTELRLPDDHSLVRELAAAGALVADPGTVELARDDYVDALVAGATRVYREALPHLRSGGEEAGIAAQTADERLAAARTTASNIIKQQSDASNALIDNIR
jgi:hypothetical protein